MPHTTAQSTRQTQDLNVLAATLLVTPRALKEDLPLGERAGETVYAGRNAIKAILSREDKRLLVIVGPCSIHDRAAALDYAHRLCALRDELGDRLFVVMRTYFEKPRTTIGWKGLINDPYLNGTCDMSAGLRVARELLLEIGEMGMPTATEMLDPIVPQYLADLVTWASIGARTIESQTHREMASGLSMPVGFKNGTDGNLQIAIDAMYSSQHAHHFLGIDQEGRTCVIETRGNALGHLILRGGHEHPNYDPVSIAVAREQMAKRGLPEVIMVDCSHANSGKRPELQPHVLRSVVQQIQDGNSALIGVMLESNLGCGSQPVKDMSNLQYGVSITDPCLGWDETEKVLRYAHRQLARGKRSW